MSKPPKTLILDKDEATWPTNVNEAGQVIQPKPGRNRDRDRPRNPRARPPPNDGSADTPRRRTEQFAPPPEPPRPTVQRNQKGPTLLIRTKSGEHDIIPSAKPAAGEPRPPPPPPPQPVIHPTVSLQIQVERSKTSQPVSVSISNSKHEIPPPRPPPPPPPPPPPVAFQPQRTPLIEKRVKRELVISRSITVASFLEIGQQIRANDVNFREHENAITMHSAILRYGMGARRAPVRRLQVRDHDQQIKHFIQSCLNKLAKENFSTTLDHLTGADEFLTDKFLDFLAESVFDQSRDQMLFAPLYGLLVFQIGCHVLNSKEVQQQQGFFLKQIRSRTVGFLTDRIALLTPAMATFIGSLATREIVPIDPVYSAVLRLLDGGSPGQLELSGRLVYLCGRKIDAVPGAELGLFARWRALSQDRAVPGHVRFFLQDLLEARSQEWEADFKLLDVRDVIRQRPRVPSRPTTPRAKIAVAENRFAGLMDDDDEEPAEEEDIDESEIAESVFRHYVSERSISPEWQSRCSGALLLVVALSQPGRVTQGLRLLSELDEAGQFDIDIARDAFRGVVLDAYQLDKGIEHCGLIFATLVRLRCFRPEDFDLIFTQYRQDVVIAFLREIGRMKLAVQIRESEFWMRYAWRPLEADHVALAREIAKMGSDDSRTDISQLFPLYAKIAELDDILKAPEEEEIADWSRAELPESVRTAVEFVTAALEIAVQAAEQSNDRAIAEVVALFADQREVVMTWLDQHASRNHLADQERANLLRVIEQNAHFQ